ncbi:hypothetical protein LguiA_001689 [Lonicera macranthoides]
MVVVVMGISRGRATSGTTKISARNKERTCGFGEISHDIFLDVIAIKLRYFPRI